MPIFESATGQTDPRLDGLTGELLNEILSYLSFAETMTLRVASKHFVSTFHKCTRLYLHPSRLDEIVEIRNASHDLRMEITELVVLGISSVPDLSNTNHTLWPRLHWHPWAHYDCAETGVEPKTTLQLNATFQETFRQYYRTILPALANHLPNLTALTYTDDATQAGLFPVKRSSMEDHVRQVEKSITDNPSDARKKVTVWWSDFEVILGLLACNSFKFKHVCILQCLDRGVDHDASRWAQATEGSLSSPSLALAPNVSQEFQLGCQRLDSLTLTEVIPHYSTRTAGPLTRHMVNIQSLIYRLASNIDHLFNPAASTQLTHTAHFIQVFWPFRPLFAVLGNQGAVAAHEAGIRCTKLESLCVMSLSSMPDIIDIKGNMTRILECMKHDELHLKDARIWVPRLGADLSYPTSELNHQQLAQRYLAADGTWFGQDVLARIASVERIKGTDEGWDFAENVVAKGVDRTEAA